MLSKPEFMALQLIRLRIPESGHLCSIKERSVNNETSNPSVAIRRELISNPEAHGIMSVVPIKMFQFCFEFRLQCPINTPWFQFDDDFENGFVRFGADALCSINYWKRSFMLEELFFETFEVAYTWYLILIWQLRCFSTYFGLSTRLVRVLTASVLFFFL